MQFAENRVLFGHDETPRLVSVELAGEKEVLVFRREGAGVDARTVTERAPFQPFLWLAADAGLTLPGDQTLSGGLHFSRLARCGSWSDFQRLRNELRDASVSHFALSDPVQQYLTATGRTLFKGMDFAELRRMQIDIETFCTPGYEFSNADRAGDHLMAIAVSDQSGWEELILVEHKNFEQSERLALEQLNALIAERDPDVLEGHNFFKFDLPYLAARARRHRVRLAWGRDGSVLSSRASRVQIAERTINYPKAEARGRHIVDTFLLVQLYDIGTRELESFGLKDVARHFGITAGGGDEAHERTYLSGLEIQEAYLHAPQKFAAYALDDVRETRALSGLLSGSYFIQAQIFPYNYQEVIVRGNATRV
ncbi:MAG: DNA polymerase II, partial [Verrucomicrobia bacterium]|nr:DNA polymerase II [Verrucomicrobiota bacterium]